MSYDTIKTAKRWLHFWNLFVSKVINSLCFDTYHALKVHNIDRNWVFIRQRRLFSNIQNLLNLRLFKIWSVYQFFSLLLQSQSVKFECVLGIFLASAVKTIFDNYACKVLIWKMKVMSLILRQIQNQRSEKNSNT